MMITKSKSGSRWVREELFRADGSHSVSYADQAWSDTISYEPGPRRLNGRCVWKACVHDAYLPPVDRLTYSVERRYDWYYVDAFRLDMVPPGMSIPSESQVPDVSYLPTLQSLFDGLYDQINLNCRESVLLYSGIAQAIPMVGGALHGVSLLNRAAQKLAKDFKRKPFTTVVKSLISLDFIDRFVISPTLDDMRKFADATDYVLRVLNTAQVRNSELATAFDFELGETVRESSSDFSFDGWGFRTIGKHTDVSRVKSKIRMLAKVVYRDQAIDPIKLWATRVGLTKPLESAWDLIPFSFVIDYFTRAGDFISHVSEELSSQDALRGKVANVFDCWRMDTQSAESRWHDMQFRYIGSDPQYRVIGTPKVQELIAKRVSFHRYRPEVMQTHSGFWEGGGFISPSLSTTRLRTLAELFIQAGL